MKLAFANADCPGQNFETAAKLASQTGFDAVELPSANVLLCPTDIIRKIFADENVRISAIQQIGSDLPQQIKMATELGCDFVRIASDPLFSRDNTLTQPAIDHLLSCADIAADGGVGILIDNQPIPGSALRLWNLLDRLNHPGIGCSWNTLSAALAGDAPAVAIPMLNSRIRYVNLQDATLHTQPMVQCDLGQGDLPLRNTINRLRGIGFDESVLVGIAQKPNQDITQLEQSLRAARTVLEQWQILQTTLPG